MVIGAGPGGYLCALELAREGKDVAVVEKDKVGGVCTNYGCIPTKALLETANLLLSIQDSSRLGVQINGEVNFEGVKRHVQLAVRKSRLGIEQLLKKAGVEVIRGRASILSPNEVLVESEKSRKEIECRNIVIATGSRPRSLPGVEIDNKIILDSQSALFLGQIPSSLLIIGGGAIGLEIATAYGALGSEVTIVEMLPNLLPAEDKRVGILIEKILKRRGMRIFTGTKVSELSVEEDRATAVLDDEDSTRIRSRKVLVSVGRKPNVDDVLGSLFDYDKEGIRVDERMRTTAENIYAVGDVTGEPMLAHVAYAEARVAALNILGQEKEISYEWVPHCIYTRPEIATFGLSEDSARERGLDIQLGEFPLIANPRAKAAAERDGFTRVIIDRSSGKLLGAQVVCSRATDMLQSLLLAGKENLPVEAIQDLIFPHPAFVEMIKEAALDASGIAVHKPTSIE